MRKTIISLLLSIVLSIIVFLGTRYDGLLVKIYGFSVAIISSGSMTPELEIGDVIIMKECQEYNENDIITYKENNEYLVTHRIIERKGNNFVTKGDNNNTEDKQIISKENIEGKVILNSKLLSWLYKHWIITVIVIILLLILL